MKLITLPTFLLASLFLPSVVLSHGDESPEALAKRNAFTIHARDSLAVCFPEAQERGLHAARIEKREDLVERRFGEANRKHKKRDLTGKFDVLSLYTTEKEPGTCILAPEETIGPYFVNTHLSRHDMKTTPLQKGIELLLTVQMVDVNTCKPVAGVTAEFWHANYLGVYSGFQFQGTLGEDYHRGMQTSDEHGIVQIVTNFPGWYPGRAVHVHIAVHLNGTLVPNDEDVGSAKKGQGMFYTGGTAPHVGQLYFPEDLLEIVESAEPYCENSKVTRTKNTEDHWYNGSGSHVQVMNVRYIKEGNISSGLVGDVIVGLDLSKNYTLHASNPTETSDPDGAAAGLPTTSPSRSYETHTTTRVAEETGETIKGGPGALTMMVPMGFQWAEGN